MENVFDFNDAKFGDKFLTKKGQCALIVGNLEEECIVHLLTEGGVFYWANYDGMPLNKDLSIDTEDILQLQIISKYQEPIDEEEMMAAAKFEASQYPHDTVIEAFIAGYQKAKES